MTLLETIEPTNGFRNTSCAALIFRIATDWFNDGRAAVRRLPGT